MSTVSLITICDNTSKGYIVILHMIFQTPSIVPGVISTFHLCLVHSKTVIVKAFIPLSKIN